MDKSRNEFISEEEMAQLRLEIKNKKKLRSTVRAINFQRRSKYIIWN